MTTFIRPEELEVGYNIPAAIGMDESEIQTPCLILDLDALEHNIKKMGDYAKAHGMRHRLHGKMHKSVDVARLQEDLGGAIGVCCQKPSEAEVFARAGFKDILVSNQVCDPLKIDRLAQLPKYGGRIIICVDDVANVSDLSMACQKHGTELHCFVEIDCGAGRCGVNSTEDVVTIAQAIDSAPNLTFTGIQAYQGAMQHMESYNERQAKLDAAIAMVQDAVDGLTAVGLKPELVSGGGTGSYYFESNSDVYNELQCGSYAFMDADYGRILDKDGKRIDQGEWQNALFILTSVMSHTKADKAICDAGLKAQSVDSGLPFIFGRDDVEYVKCSDEHGVISDPQGVLKINEKLKLVPGHCDPTCNVHDWYVGVRNGKVETLWPVSARGKMF
ncbi:MULTISPECIES: 3-hydroxy-D-aspartate aldolase BhcC [unclassified Marinobacter]|uniref:3-hydroxy-D-aspartate aldolase BhcC n=1 Tax=unclassified Marinobacter TaxID=83889 RepID=UPI0020101FF6|nr:MULTISPECIES: 3-hydroxy-D-aspartate aldolase BhcC [unclassified Marinobacter]MCL1477154.1 DSD1 family PLP-dependent enzyme [Marinobacter sp.]MCL1484850.1 DSD1 family PLP-dependent enzyme [Marinobacter sp.]UQG56490.1 DSD1 family PLP-dependent enzyme [Marinobacter sp. M4C]UQG65294.1 DSD1 family PLP-dependent enzyme [Marinobacter sp. M2C]UQG69573.1 DSD1 family PLP-dependent enzyme [Marinobacter sp. M1C]